MTPTDSSAGNEKAKVVPSTVRKRAKNPAATTQRYLPFAEIKNDTVLLKNGGLRAVLEIEPLNFNLKSETEQQGIIVGYESFINTIIFPLQIVVVSSRVNIEPYIDHIHKQAAIQQNTLLKEQTVAYATFVEKIVELADIMQKKFYVIVPLDDVPKKKNGLSQLFVWLNVDDTLAKALQRNQKFAGQLNRLKERMELVETGLKNIGLGVKRLKTIELIQLYYHLYNGGNKQAVKLPTDGNFNTEKSIL